MALATENAIISLVLKDTGGKFSTKDFKVDPAEWDPATGLIADLKTIRDNLVTAYNVITNCLIYRGFITLPQTEDTLEFPATECNTRVVGSVVANLETAGKKTTLQVPGPDVGIFEGGTGKAFNTIDVTDAGLNTFLDFYQATGGDFLISDGEKLDDAANPADSGKRITLKGNTKV